MILILGGTTEGCKAAGLLDRIGEPYIYSTKTKVCQQVEGRMVHGAMDMAQLAAFCRQEGVRLLLDAAHPFAEALHHTVSEVSRQMNIPMLRFERQYPSLEHQAGVVLFDSFDELIGQLECSADLQPVLALTGVQTIARFKRIWQQRPCFFRILDTDRSWQLGMASGIGPQYLLPSSPAIQPEALDQLVRETGARVLLTKESGESGYFNEKLAVAQKLNIPLWVVRRTEPGRNVICADSIKSLLQQIYRMRKDVLRKSEALRGGFTTGTCVTAAAAAAFGALMTGEFPELSRIVLPDGTVVGFPVFETCRDESEASCVVVKDAGDDPDVTHAAEIGCRVKLVARPGIRFLRGTGIGLVTMPGLQVGVGEPAINPGPRRMMETAVRNMAAQFAYEGGVELIPFIPQGGELAQRTFNPRVGVAGGLSVLGTTGHIQAFSAEAFLNSLREQVKVAVAAGCTELVATSGKRSENRMRKLLPPLPDVAFIHYGNLVGDMLTVCAELGVGKLHLGMMTGKAVKLGEGQMDTHSKHVRFNADFAVRVAADCNYTDNILQQLSEQTLANAITAFIPFSPDEPFWKRLSELCSEICHRHVGDCIAIDFVLLGES